jgi:hypothetical protein
MHRRALEELRITISINCRFMLWYPRTTRKATGKQAEIERFSLIARGFYLKIIEIALCSIKGKEVRSTMRPLKGSKRNAHPTGQELLRGVLSVAINPLLLLCSTLLVGSAAVAQQPVQTLPKAKGGSCPSGYTSSGNYCSPMKHAKPALPKVGSCPYGYSSNGSYCLAYDKKAREALPKNGSCPYGFSSSGAYCVKNSTQ